jgi:hypothetical protein
MIYYVVAPLCHQVYRFESERILTVARRKNKGEKRKKRGRGKRKGREEKEGKNSDVGPQQIIANYNYSTFPTIPDPNLDPTLKVVRVKKLLNEATGRSPNAAYRKNPPPKITTLKYLKQPEIGQVLLM